MGRIVKRGTKDRPRFYLKYRDVDGVERTRAAKGAYTKAHARVMLAEIERRIMGGKVGIIEPTREERERNTITVRELADKFCAEFTSPKIKDPDHYIAEAKSVLKRIPDEMGKRGAASIRDTDIERLRDALLADKYAPRTVNLTLSAVSKMYTWARKLKVVDVDNPVKGCERPEPEVTLDYLSLDEVVKLLTYAEEHANDVFPMIKTALLTGMRKGEVFGLRWTDVHLDQARIDVARSYTRAPKSGKPRYLPMHPDLVPTLRAWRERCPQTDAGLVFPVLENNGGMGESYDMLGLPALMKAAKCHVPVMAWHSLRHSFASHFMMAGGSILTLQKLLGHSTLEMTLIYAHLSPDHLAGEIGRIDFKPRMPASVTPINAAQAG